MKIYFILFFLFMSFSTKAQSQKASSSELRNTLSAILPLSAAGPLPKVIDMSDSFPPPGNQCTINSCVSYACTYNLFTYLNCKNKKLGFNYKKSGIIDKSKIFSPFFSFFYNKTSTECDKSSSQVLKTLQFLLDTGNAVLSDFELEACDPDNCNSVPPANVSSNAKKNKLQNFAWIYTSQLNQYKFSPSALLKRFLYTNTPIVIIMDINDNFKNLGKVDSNYVYNEEYEPTINDHTMVCTGYDENKSALRFINSYGEWGYNNRIWISTKVIDKHLEEAYVADVDKNILINGYVRFMSSPPDNNLLNHNKSYYSLYSNDLKFIDNSLFSLSNLTDNAATIRVIKKGADNLDYVSYLKLPLNGSKTLNLNGEKMQVSLPAIKNTTNKYLDKYIKIAIEKKADK